MTEFFAKPLVAEANSGHRLGKQQRHCFVASRSCPVSSGLELAQGGGGEFDGSFLLFSQAGDRIFEQRKFLLYSGRRNVSTDQ